MTQQQYDMNDGWDDEVTLPSNPAKIFSEDNSHVISGDLVAILLAFTSKQGSIPAIVSFWKEAISGNMTSSVNTAMKQIDTLVKLAETYSKDYSVDELKAMYHGAMSQPDHDFVAMARLVLLHKGVKAVILMKDGSFFTVPSPIASTIIETVQDPSFLKEWGISQLQSNTSNNIKRLNVVSAGVRFDTLTPQNIATLSSGVAAWFLTGSGYSEEFFVENPESFKPLKSVLSALPMVADVNITYDLVLSDFFKVEFPEVLPVVIAESDPQDVYPMATSIEDPVLTLLLSEDDDSPYNACRSPSIHVPAEDWDWPDVMESAQQEATRTVASQGKKGNVSHDIQMVKRELLARDAHLRVNKKKIFYFEKSLGRLPPTYAPFSKYIKCHKLGFSKLSDVAAYPDEIHFCQYTTLGEIEAMRLGHKYFFVDPMNLACLVIPKRVWALSQSVISAKQGVISPVITPTHMSVPSNTLPMKGVMIVMSAYSVSLSNLLIEAWSKQLSDDAISSKYNDLRRGFSENIISKPSKRMRNLLPPVRSIGRILTALEAMIHYRFGTMFLSGGSSKIGKSKLKDSRAYGEFDDKFSSGYENDFSGYDWDDSVDDDPPPDDLPDRKENDTSGITVDHNISEML